MNRKREIEDGVVMECTPVIRKAELEIYCDSCGIEMGLFERRFMAARYPGNCYQETVRLLRKYSELAKAAPEGSKTLLLSHDFWNQKKEGSFVWSSEKWTCKVTAGLDEAGLRCLTFEEVA